MRRVQILSPFRGNFAAERARNVAYAQAALLDCLERDEAPFAPHLLYPAVLDESDPEQRMQGISAGLEWLAVAEAVVIYEDLGVSEGMTAEQRAATVAGVPVERRRLSGWSSDAVTQEIPTVTMTPPKRQKSVQKRLESAPRYADGDGVVLSAGGYRLAPKFTLTTGVMLERVATSFTGRWATPDLLRQLRFAVLREVEETRPDLTCEPKIDPLGSVKILWKYKTRRNR